MIAVGGMRARGLFPRVATPTYTPIAGTLALRGDPTFVSSSLSTEQLARYDTIKTLAMDKEGGSRDPWNQAGRDCIWWAGHDLQTWTQAILTVFRITGDLWFLDLIDEIAELMRSNLHDSWRGTLDGTDGTTDGFLNWVQRYNGGTTHTGKDTWETYDYKAHAASAHMAYALHNNRDLTSPKGYNYGAHADFWRDYHVNHFEAKWRARNNKPSGFPIRANWPDTLQSYADWSKWHYYVGGLTGNAIYTDEAKRMIDVLLPQFCSVSTVYGDASTWKRSNPNFTSYGQYLMPTTYAEFLMGVWAEYTLEGFHTLADPAYVQRMALTITQLIRDEPNAVTNGMARDVGGGVSQCGWSASSTDFRRISAFMYQNMLLGLLAAWDPSAPILRGLNEESRAYAATQGWDYTRVLAAQMLDVHLNGE